MRPISDTQFRPVRFGLRHFANGPHVAHTAGTTRTDAENQRLRARRKLARCGAELLGQVISADKCAITDQEHLDLLSNFQKMVVSRAERHGKVILARGTAYNAMDKARVRRGMAAVCGLAGYLKAVQPEIF